MGGGISTSQNHKTPFFWGTIPVLVIICVALCLVFATTMHFGVRYADIIGTEPPTVVYVEDATVERGETSEISILIKDAPNVSGSYMKLNYDTELISITSVESLDMNFTTFEEVNGSVLRFAAIHYPDPVTSSNISFLTVNILCHNVTPQTTPLSLEVVSLQHGGYEEIPRVVEDGVLEIVDTTPPQFYINVITPVIIPVDTDDSPGWHETADVMVAVSDLSQIKDVWLYTDWEEKELQFVDGIYETTLETNSNVTAGAYMVSVVATDVYGNNVTVKLPIAVTENGDASLNGKLSLYDALYIFNHVNGVSGFEEIQDGVCDVDNNEKVDMADGIYLLNHIFGTQGYGVLH